MTLAKGLKERDLRITSAKVEEANESYMDIPFILNETLLMERDMLKVESRVPWVECSINREAWLQEAKAEKRVGFLKTCQVIISLTIGTRFAENYWERTWFAGAKECKKRDSIETSYIWSCLEKLDVG